MKLEQNQIECIKKELDRRKGCPQDIITFDDGDYVRIVDLSTNALESLIEEYDYEYMLDEVLGCNKSTSTDDGLRAWDLPEGLEEEVEEYGDTVLLFGKYKGSKLNEVPREYLKWLYDQEWVYDDLKEAIYLYLV